MLLFILGALWVLGFYAGCEKSEDGPLSVSEGSEVYRKEGFFLGGMLDSTRTIHLVGDTLYVTLKKIWSFSNCALKSLDMNFRYEDSTMWIEPTVNIESTTEDCPAPYFRPDTTVKVLFGDNKLEDYGVIKIKNDLDSVIDSILLRRGSISLDTFSVYMDSSFGNPHNYPLRTKGEESLGAPTILRVLDSLTPRVFYWRTMKSNCTHRVDVCESTVADTLYPSTWNVSDTNLVPVHYACADTDSVYCINSKWENDSTSLGDVQERPDTIWNYSTYYLEKIPKCGTYESFRVINYGVGQRVSFIRSLFVPDEYEKFCGPSLGPEWMVYNLNGSVMVVDSLGPDSLISVWKEAGIAPDTLIVDSSASTK